MSCQTIAIATDKRSLTARLPAMEVQRVVPILTVPDLPAAVAEYQAITGLGVLMDHGWIVTLGADDGTAQLSLMTRDRTAPLNPAVSVFVDDVDAVLDRVRAAGLPIVHPRTVEDWGVTRFFYRDAAGTVINVGMHT